MSASGHRHRIVAPKAFGASRTHIAKAASRLAPTTNASAVDNVDVCAQMRPVHMTVRTCFCGLALILLPVMVVSAATRTEKVRNEKVLVVEQTLAPGETTSLPGDRASVAVYLDDGSIEVTPAKGKPRTETVKRGEAVFRLRQAGTVKNAGSSALRIVWAEYLGKGGSETWGTAGLAPDYRLLFENDYGRVYDIRMAAGRSEPQHTHHDRVVICLSGAELEHEMPDGRKEISTLKTGEIAWRRGGTHVGHNLGKTDLWVIAIEPK
jgi:quercetin dioxygenase-like cupin family protein